MSLKFINGKSWNSPIIHKVFRRPNCYESLKGSPQNFRHSETQTINRFVIPLLSKKFDTRTNLKHTSVRPRCFSAMWDKKDNKIVIAHYPKNYRYRKISGTQGSPYEISRYCETKKIDEIVIPLLSKKFLIPERFWNTEGFAHNVFPRFGTNNFRRKNVTPPFLSIYFFHTRKFLNHKSVPHKFFRYCETKNLRRKIVKLPHLAKKFQMP